MLTNEEEKELERLLKKKYGVVNQYTYSGGQGGDDWYWGTPVRETIVPPMVYPEIVYPDFKSSGYRITE